MNLVWGRRLTLGIFSFTAQARSASLRRKHLAWDGHQQYVAPDGDYVDSIGDMIEIDR